MLLPTHLAVAIGTTTILKYFGIEHSGFTTALITMTLLPDLDVLWTHGIRHHHETVFHMPIFWVVASLGAIAISPWVGYGMLIGSMQHMILDTFGYAMGLRWMAPFSNEEFSFTKLKPYGSLTRWERGYLKSKLFHYEIVIIGVMILVIAFLR
jgi:hypothetical protein